MTPRSLHRILNDAARSVAESDALRGYRHAMCTHCSGRGEGPGSSDRDCHGSYWVRGERCQHCGGQGYHVEPVPRDERVATLRAAADRIERGQR